MMILFMFPKKTAFGFINEPVKLNYLASQKLFSALDIIFFPKEFNELNFTEIT